jgi:hypothetical protein
VSGCSSPSTFSRCTIVCRFIASAASYLAWPPSTNTKLIVLVSVSDAHAQAPSLSAPASVCSFSSASLYLSWLPSTPAKLLMLVSVSGWRRAKTSQFPPRHYSRCDGFDSRGEWCLWMVLGSLARYRTFHIFSPTPSFSTEISLLMHVFEPLIVGTLLTNLKNLHFGLVPLSILSTRTYPAVKTQQ